MMEIEIPRLDTLSALSFSHNLGQLNIYEPVAIFPVMNWVQPFGMLLASLALRQLRNRFKDIQFTLHYDRNNEAVSYASHMGFFKSISELISIGNMPGEAAGNENYIPITGIDFNEISQDLIKRGHMLEIGEVIEETSSRLAKVLCRDNDEMGKLMTYLIREILRNIPEHSKSSKALICGQYWSNQIAEIAIIDEGIGVKESLMANMYHREHANTDEAAIRYAIKAGISQAFDPQKKNPSHDVWANSGFGLFMVSEICKMLQGTFCLVSGESAIVIDEDGETAYDAHIQGTAIQMRFSTENLKSSHEIIRTIAKQGEERAKELRNAFRQASKPSKGLIT